MATFQAEPQMHPGVANLDAVFANVDLGVRDLDLIEMCAGCPVPQVRVLLLDAKPGQRKIQGGRATTATDLIIALYQGMASAVPLLGPN